MSAESIHVLMPKVMAAIGVIGKSRTNQQQNFRFRGIDDVMNALHEPLTKHGVFYVPEVLESEYSTYTTSKGTGMRNCTLRVRYTFYGPSGDSIACVGAGEASDSGDKATSKALAMALKYALLQTFCIPTEEQAQEDPDASVHQRAGDAWNVPSDGPSCPTCSSPVWDNTEDPKRGKRPKWKCKDTSCGWASWDDDPFTRDVQATAPPTDPQTSAVEPEQVVRSEPVSEPHAAGRSSSEGSSAASSPSEESLPSSEDPIEREDILRRLKEWVGGNDKRHGQVRAKVNQGCLDADGPVPGTIADAPLKVLQDVAGELLDKESV